MKTVNYLILGLVFLVLSCNKEELIDDSENIAKELVPFDFYYGGENYSTSYYEDENSVKIFSDSEVEKVLKNIFENPNLIIAVNEDGEISYFDTEEEYENYHSIGKGDMELSDTKQSKALGGGEYAEVIFYKDKFTGDRFRIALTWITSNVEYDYINNIVIRQWGMELFYADFNDEITSITANVGHIPAGNKLYIHGYEHTMQSGRSFRFEITTTGTHNYNLKNYVFGTFKNWNDEVSSVRVRFEN